MPTTETTERLLSEALDAYRAANRTITLASLLLLAQGVRDAYGDSAQALVTEWSDQGDYLSGCMTVERGPEGAEDYDDQDAYAANLDESTAGIWQMFAVNTEGRSDEFRFDVAQILAEVPALLAELLEA